MGESTEAPSAPSAPAPSAGVLAAFAPLSPRRQKFVAHYLQHSDGTKAAIAAGFAPKSAANRAYKLLHHSAEVQAAIAAAREQVAAMAVYDAATAMRELSRGLEFAIETKNATAYARCCELRARLHGLLVEKVEAKLDHEPSLRKAMELGEKRIARWPVIEGTFEEVTTNDQRI